MRTRIALLGEQRIGVYTAISQLAGLTPGIQPNQSGVYKDQKVGEWFQVEVDQVCRFNLKLSDCHGWLVVMPVSEQTEDLALAGVISWLREVEYVRRKAAELDSLPVMILIPLQIEPALSRLESLEKIHLETERAAIMVARRSGSDPPRIGGLSLIPWCVVLEQTGMLDCMDGMKTELKRVGDKYRKKVFFSSLVLFFSVFLLAVFAVSLFVGAAALSGVLESCSNGEAKRLIAGLTGKAPALFWATSLEPMRVRNKQIRDFLRVNPGLALNVKESLLLGENRLKQFISCVGESVSWPDWDKIENIPSLRHLVTSLDRWRNEDTCLNSTPLISAAYGRKNDIIQSLKDADSCLAWIGKRLIQGDACLDPPASSRVDWGQWAIGYLEWCSQPWLLSEEDALWGLDELASGRLLLDVQANDLQQVWELASALALIPGKVDHETLYGYLVLPEQSSDPHTQALMSLERAKSFATIFDRPGFRIKAGPALRISIQMRAQFLREVWLKSGKNKLQPDFPPATAGKDIWLAWMIKVSDLPSWQEWGKLVGSLGVIAERGKLSPPRSTNPWTDLRQFYSDDAKKLQVSGIRVSCNHDLAKHLDSGSFIEVDNGAGGVEMFPHESHGVSEGLTWFVFKKEKLAEIVWLSEKPVQVRMFPKNGGEPLVIWSAIGMTGFLQLSVQAGSKDVGFAWLPNNKLPEIPELLKK